jgi:hypothetical protein
MFDAIPPHIRDAIARVLLAVAAFAVVWLLRHLLVRLVRRIFSRFEPFQTGSVNRRLEATLGPPVSLLTLAIAIDISSRILDLGPVAEVPIYRVTRSLVVIAVLLLLNRIISSAGQSRSGVYSFTGLAVDSALLPFIRTGMQLLLFAIGAIVVAKLFEKFRLNEWPPTLFSTPKLISASPGS